MFFMRLFLGNTGEKKSGITEIVSLQTAVKCGHGFGIGAVGTGTRHKKALMLCAEKVAQCKTRESP